MQPDNRYTDKRDDFSRKIADKLRDHRLPVDPDVWESLAGKLPQRGKRISPKWALMAAGAAAVALLLLLLPLPHTNGPLLTQSELEQVAKENITTHEKNADMEKVAQPQKAAAPKKNRQPEIIADPKVEVKPVEIAITAQIDQPAVAAQPEEVSPSKTDEPKENPEPAKTIKPETELLPVKELFAERIPVRKSRGKQSFAAALGSGSPISDFTFSGKDANLVYDNPIPGGDYNNGENSGNQYNLLTPNDYSDIEHRPPVSFSLTVDLPIGAKTSIETGLSYTYLFSRFRRNDNLIYRGTLQQHYIGVPVNLRYGIWKNDLWNIYLFGGGSMEKGIRSIYKQEIEQNGSIVFHTNVYSGISGFQFSAQGGAGFSYRLHNNLYLFGEPKLIYYFRNNQPMSARTENPFVFGLNMGIRIRFNEL